MKKDRKNIILESLAAMLEEKNMSKITTASLAEKSNKLKQHFIDTFQVKDLFMLNFSHFVMIQFLQNVMSSKKKKYLLKKR